MKRLLLMAGALMGVAYGQTVWVGPLNGSVTTDRPFSGTEQRHSIQVLGDGTRIETTETNRLYRDAQGRTRTEHANGLAEIRDPVQGLSFEIDTVGKQVRYAVSQGRNSAATTLAAASLAKLAAEVHALQSAGAQGQKAQPTSAGGDEDLGTSVVNGVAARGTRHTTTIAEGEIGNDRPIKVVSERWYSEDLQLLVKSGNSDPRFGDTTYELTNISQAVPDPALFQMPADYAKDHGLK